MRPWYRIHCSTLSVLAIVLAGLVFINIPGDRMLGDSGRYHHGWPYFYFERSAQPRTWWSFSGTSTEFHLDALLLNVLAAACITALAACAAELWIRRYGRLLRFTIMTMLTVTAIVAAILGVVVRDLHRCWRQQEAIDQLAAQGSIRVSREERKYDWLRSLFGSNWDGTIHRIDFDSTSREGGTVPDLSALVDLRFLDLEGIALQAGDDNRLAALPKLETLFLTIKSLRDEPSATLTPISKNPVLAGLFLDGDQFDDEKLLHVSVQSGMKHLGVKSARITADSLTHVAKLKALESLWIEGAPLRDADFSPLAKASKFKTAIFYRCNLSQADERRLLSLWPDGNLHTGAVPDGKSRLVQAFTMEQNVEDYSWAAGP